MSAGLNGDTELEEQQVNGRWPDVFFRHVPKTAGTSLMASLSAALGEVHAIRLHDVGTDTQELARRRIAINPAPVYIMSGHINCNKILRWSPMIGQAVKLGLHLTTRCPVASLKR